VLPEVLMDSRRTAGGPGPVVPSRAASRRRGTRDEALARVDRWKRGIAIVTVVGFGVLLGLVGAAGARGGATSPTTPPASDPSRDDARRAAPSQAPDDGFFSGGGDGGFGLGDGGGSQPSPFGRSGAS
jgi:hypothetical protein